MADNIDIKDGNLASKSMRTTEESGVHIPHQLPMGDPVDFSPRYNGPASQLKRNLAIDPDNQLAIRGPIHTDELSTRVNFANSSLAVSLGSVSVSQNIVTGTGTNFLSLVIDKGDYFKLAADGESTLVQIESIESDTELTLVSAYTGSASGTGERWIMKTVTGSGATITVASGQCTIAAGTTANAVSEVKRQIDYSPVNGLIGVSVSQRIANQDIYIGFRDPLSTLKYFTWFRLTGTTNTVVDVQSGYNPTAAPSASEIASVTSISLPNGLTTASIINYRVETSFDRVRFYAQLATDTSGAQEIPLAEIKRVAPHPNDPLEIVVRVVNGATPPGSNTNVVVDFLYAKNFNKLQVEQSGNLEGFVALAAPGQNYSGSASANNTDIVVLDCSQISELFIQATGTFSLTTTLQWSNDPTFANPISGSMHSIAVVPSTLVSTITAAGIFRTTRSGRYARLRTTAYTSGTIVLSVFATQAPAAMPAFIATQAVQGGTWTVQPGNTANTTPWLTIVRAESSATGALSKLRILAAATTNATVVKGSAGRVFFIKAFNTSASTKFLKMYNKATAPTVGTDAVVETYPLAVGYTAIDFNTFGDSFATGIGLGITGAIADADTTALAANDVVLNVFYL